jgi:hypothetical protein
MGTRAEIGPFEATWNALSGRLPPSTRRRAKQGFARMLERRGGLDPASVAAEIAHLAGKLDHLRQLRAALETVDPGNHGPAITAAIAACRRPPPPRRAPAPRIAAPEAAGWPAGASTTLEAALRRPATGYDPGGPLGHLSEKRQELVRWGARRFHAWLLESGRAGEGLTPEILFSYVASMREENRAPLTIRDAVDAILLCERAALELGTAVESPEEEFGIADSAPIVEDEFGSAEAAPIAAMEFDPAADSAPVPTAGGPLGWLRRAFYDLKKVAEPKRSKLEFRIEADQLVVAGRDLMDEADGGVYGVRSAVAYRTGLFMMLLGLRCIRLSNILGVQLPNTQVLPWQGRLVLPDDKPGWMEWPASATKNRRRARTTIPSLTRPYIDRWISYWRKALPGAQGSMALFVSALHPAEPLGPDGARNAFEAATSRFWKKRIPPHMVRSICTAWICENLPDQVMNGLITDLLWHSSSESDEPYKEMVIESRAQRMHDAAWAAKAARGIAGAAR